MQDSDIEHIKEMITGGYNRGDLNDNDNTDWWSIEH